VDKSVLVKTNEFQTAITQEWLGQYPLDVQEEFMELIGSVPLIKWMIGERPRAKDLPRDEKGRIIVDITHPHILEDMDYFMPAIKFYKENDGQYTLLKPNSNPNSEYGKWFHEEVRRCREGYVRESDGEWVTGLMYWFLNYCPIMINVESKNTPGVYNRVEGFPAFWEGIYYRFHYIDQARKAGRHAMELSRRGSGKSFTLAGLMSHNLILGENEEAKKRVTTVLTAYTKEYLSDKDGTLTKFTPMIDHCAAKTEFPRLMLKRSASDMVWRMGYKNSNGNEMGSLNSVMALSVKDDEGKIRGKRGFILFEEMGNYPNFRDVWDNVRDSVTEGNHAFALLYAVGTAGDKESDFSSIKHILYNPSAYKILALDNVYDKTGKGAKKFAYFFPSYISRAGCMDKNGNSDVVAALMEILMNRWEVKHGGEPETIMSVIAQNPITPEEAILKAQSAFFPAAAINERLRQLDQNPHAYDEVYVGTLVDTGSKVIFKATDDIPIRDRASSNQEKGALEIYAMPPDDIPPNRYIAGADPIENDQAQSESLYCVFVFDLFTDLPVAMYFGRKQFANDNFELTWLLLRFFNATLLYESNRKMLYAYFQSKQALWMLADCPEYLRSKGLVKYSMFGSGAKGVSVNDVINGEALQMTRDWMQSTIPMEVKDERGQTHIQNIPKLYFLVCRVLLKEWLAYGPGVNTDTVSSFNQVMLYRQHFISLYGGSPSQELYDEKDDSDDDFFEKDWQRHLQQGNYNFTNIE
jgi:hypothetical protein